jgi:hypothetical protein
MRIYEGVSWVFRPVKLGFNKLNFGKPPIVSRN